jgi:phosphoribosylformimino-5-aminoimidazole carboxamide ribotide isomerase
MKVYPAIDILHGRAVRLKQGRSAEATVYGDPVDMARKWRTAGAEWIHVVDLNGAFEGAPANRPMVQRILQDQPSLKIQLGGGIRSMDIVEEMFAAGIQRVVLGTAAVENRAFVEASLKMYPQRIVMGIDARDGIVKTAGWARDSNIGALDLARELEQYGARLVVYTDIARDGVLQGPNIEGIAQMIQKTELAVIASGGVSTVEDVRALSSLGEPRLDGVIIGKALYEGRFRLEDVLAYAR